MPLSRTIIATEYSNIRKKSQGHYGEQWTILELFELIETEVSQNRRPEDLRRSSRGLSPEGAEWPVFFV